MANGEGCMCAARYAGECACDNVDWNPPKKEFIGLTDDEIRHCLYDLDTQDFLQFARAIEQAVKMAIEAMEAMQSEANARNCGLKICDDAILACKEVLKPHPDCDEACMFQCQMEKQHGMTYEQGFDHGWEARLAEEQPAQEPVAWLSTDSKANEIIKTHQWQGLTDDEIGNLIRNKLIDKIEITVEDILDILLEQQDILERKNK